MQNLKEQMEEIKEARSKIEDNKKDSKEDKMNSSVDSEELNVQYNSNGDEIRENIIIAASLNEEINARLNTHKE